MSVHQFESVGMGSSILDNGLKYANEDGQDELQKFTQKTTVK
jgi:hypothetical protein